jgi:molybdopterin molybdotransferase
LKEFTAMEDMIPVEEALRIVLDHTSLLDPVEVDLLDALGLVVSEDICSDIEMPPFDKAAVDGYAVIAKDTEGASPEQPAVLDLLEEIQAGTLPRYTLSPGKASRIMTGAPVPESADAVVMVEDTESIENGRRARILRPIKSGRSICYRGEDIALGQTVMKAGTLIRPQEIGIAASVGKVRLRVYRRPEVAIIATGSEIVEPDRVPGLGQIRNSNGASMSAQALQAGTEVTYLGIADDTTPDLQKKIEEGLTKDILMLSGGVSMGSYDLVKKTLSGCGVKILFDKVNIKPGKPVTFGVRGTHLIFGLPGNPVSTVVTFEEFVRPAIRKMMGMKNLVRPTVTAILEEEFKRRAADRREYAPAFTEYDGEEWHTLTVGSHGSADLLSTTKANSLMIIPQGVIHIPAGEQVHVQLIEVDVMAPPAGVRFHVQSRRSLCFH